MRFMFTLAAAMGLLLLTPLMHSGFGVSKALRNFAEARVTIIEKNSHWPRLQNISLAEQPTPEETSRLVTR